MNWISVKDKLPEAEDDCLCYIHAPKHVYEDRHGKVYTEDEIKDVFIGGYDGEWWWVKDLMRLNREFVVTHWMPLPEPPR